MYVFSFFFKIYSSAILLNTMPSSRFSADDRHAPVTCYDNNTFSQLLNPINAYSPSVLRYAFQCPPIITRHGVFLLGAQIGVRSRFVFLVC